MTAEFRYAPNFTYGGDLTGDNMLALDNYALDRDVARLAQTVYPDEVSDGTFFDMEDILANFFSGVFDSRKRSFFE